VESIISDSAVSPENKELW